MLAQAGLRLAYWVTAPAPKTPFLTRMSDQDSMKYEFGFDQKNILKSIIKFVLSYFINKKVLWVKIEWKFKFQSQFDLYKVI